MVTLCSSFVTPKMLCARQGRLRRNSPYNIRSFSPQYLDTDWQLIAFVIRRLFMGTTGDRVSPTIIREGNIPFGLNTF